MHRGSLQRHSKFECGVTPKFGCNFCGRRFSQRSNLSRHVVDIHRNVLEDFMNKRSVFRVLFYLFFHLNLMLLTLIYILFYAQESRNEGDLILEASDDQNAM